MIPTYSQLVAARTDAPKSFTFHLSDSASFTVRAMLRDGEPWFVAADVCAALELGNVSAALSRLDDDERTLISIEGIHAGPGNPAVNLINESGLYSLVLGSRKPEAKRFKKWVTSEVLPAIRKTGGYARNTPVALPDFSDPVAAARAWADATESKREAEAALALAAPKVEFVDRYVSAPTSSMGIREVVKLLKTNGHTVNEHSFTEWLVSSGYMYRKQSSRPDKTGKLTPAAQHEKAGRFETKTGQGTNGHTVPVYKFTGKGVSWIVGEWAKHQVRDADLFA